jgi:endonuclease YncB( thermonuclease family)
MPTVIPFRRRSRLPVALGAIAVAVLAFAATTIFMNWRSTPVAPQSKEVVIIRPTPKQFGPIEVVDGDTVRHQGLTYRLIGFDTPEKGDNARCDYERERAEAATARLRSLVASGKINLQRVACACRPGTEGTKNCNYGRLCGSLTIAERDVGQILISEGLAHPYVCGATSCPRRRPWCDSP